MSAIITANQRVAGISLSAGAAAMSFISGLEMLGRRNVGNRTLMTALIGSSFCMAFCLMLLASLITTGDLGWNPIRSGVITVFFEQISQILLWRAALTRAKSVSQRLRHQERLLTIVWGVAIVACTLAFCFTLSAGILSEGMVSKYVNNPFYKDNFRILDCIIILLYGSLSSGCDFKLLSIILKNIENLKRSSAEKDTRVRFQRTCIILGVCFKLTDTALKITSLRTTFTPIDAYVRIFSICFETWCLLKLGVTVEEVLKQSPSKSATSSTKPPVTTPPVIVASALA